MIPAIPKRYEVRSLIGEGGSGRVYRVQDSIRDRELALKLVTPAESAFLRREFDTLRQIRHENLIQVFDWGTLPSGEAYYTMELIEGGDWSQRMGKPQTADEVRRVLTGILRGLAHLHCHSEIHGDLKPGNILLGAGGVVKITDAGMGGSDGHADVSSGTPGYAAPEVLGGATADLRSDLYSVGVMAYEALTVKHPFAGRTLREVISGQLEGWVPSPAAHGVHVPADLERAVMRALERQPGLRHGSADEFMEGFGVEDRVGSILGGKLVGRDKEIAEIEKLLHANEPGSPTLLYVTGEPGIGKSALMEEVLHRAVSSEVDIFKCENSPESESGEVLEELLSICGTASTRPVNLVLLADALCDRSDKKSLLLWLRSSGNGSNPARGWVLELARLIWAISLERNEQSRTLFVTTADSNVQAGEPFEACLRPASLAVAEVTALFESMLGHARLEPELIERIRSLTGGNPGAVRSCLTSLMDQGAIQRRGGLWTFHEGNQIKALQLPAGVNPWAHAWSRLQKREQEVLSVLSLVTHLTVRDLAAGLGERAGSVELVVGLDAKGWLHRRAARVSLASGPIRQVVLDQTSLEQRQAIAGVLLAAPGTSLDREGRAELALACKRSPDVLVDGIWASEEATKRGECRTAERRLRACLQVAAQAGDQESGRRISLLLAESLHQQGDEQPALECLRSPYPWGGTEPDQETSARQARLLGTIEAAQGNLDIARRHFLIAARVSEDLQDPSIHLQSHAALAELDWRHGDETTRRDSIRRVRGILASDVGAKGGHDERANLTYQLGAALIQNGEPAAADKILTAGLELPCSDYWRMRLANALASSMYNQGEHESALKWINEAWRCCESAGADSFKTRILFNRAGIFYGMGRHRESVDQHKVALQWARRVGSKFDYLSACAGLSINLLQLARYEAAIDEAVSARLTARNMGDLGEHAKALELEALAYFYVGDYEKSEQLVDQGLILLLGWGYVTSRPRLGWLKGRLLIHRNCYEEAEKTLRGAEATLLETKDWEDLPSVQIELGSLQSKTGDANAGLRTVRELTRAAERKGAFVVQLLGACALAEILLAGNYEDQEGVDLVTAALARAEQSGGAETAWWLSYCLGEIASRSCNPREAQSCFRRAIQLLTQIAQDLSPANRKLYLGRPHTRTALDRIKAAEQSLVSDLAP
jgi:serine/threonine protein kinase/tetratricopeptide (TPR) repeat protein